MKRNLIGLVDLKPQLECEQSVIVEYFRIKGEEDDEKYDIAKPYGLEVVKKQKIDGITYREIKTVDCISDSTEKIDNILNLLCRNSVTPVCVSDVLEDLKVVSKRRVCRN